MSTLPIDPALHLDAIPEPQPLARPVLEGDPVFRAHLGGKMEIAATVALEDRDDLSIAYTPGVARVCSAIAADPALFAEYTWAARTVAVVTTGRPCWVSATSARVPRCR